MENHKEKNRSKILDERVHQRRQRNGQQVYEMLNITDHQENINQSCNEISPLSTRIITVGKKKEIISIGEDVERLETLCDIGM